MNNPCFWLKHFLIACIGLLFCSCDEIADAAFDRIIDCVDLDGPEIETSKLEDAFEGVEYSQVILASIKREPQDDHFLYDFEIEGRLPEGIFLRQEKDSRRIYIEGITTESGNFPIKITVRVEEPRSPYSIFEEDHDDTDLCYHSASKEFTLHVQPNIN